MTQETLMTNAYQKGFDAGQEAVRQRPPFAPSNPYDENENPDEFEGWEDGAISAGITTDYHNGIRRE